MSARAVDRCRVCGDAGFDTVVDLGEMPLANAFLDRASLERAEPRYPLRAMRCRGCGLVCLSVVVDPDEMFRDYLYVTGTSDTMRDHFARSAAAITGRFLAPGALVVEIGSNDGTLLAAFGDGVRVLGVEPARNIAEIARSRGVPTEDAFFSTAVAEGILARHGPASAVLANNVVAHVDDLADLMGGVRALIGRDGIFVFEVPSLLDLVATCCFDTIYHEHLSYFSLGVLVRLAERHGLAVFDAESIGVHGGSLRVFVGSPARARAPAVEDLLARERAAGLDDNVTYLRFAERVGTIRRRVRAILEEEVTAGRRCAAYGAPAKGNTLLCSAGIGPDLIAFVADKNRLKQGLFTPGTHIEVAAPEQIEADRPDLLLLLAWNFADEIRRQQAAFAARGGRFLVPIPEPRVLGGDGHGD